MTVAGKTGTATNPLGPIALVVRRVRAGASIRASRVAIVVENVGYGATYAAPIAREVLRTALESARYVDRRAHLQQPLPTRPQARRRRHGDRLLRHRHPAAPARRDQGAARAVRRRRRVRPPLLPRGRIGGEALASQHRQHLRRRPRRRHVLHRHGARRRPVARRDHRRRRTPSRAGRDRLRRADRKRSRVRASPGSAASRHQAGQHPRHQGRRREALRLRHRARGLAADDGADASPAW